MSTNTTEASDAAIRVFISYAREDVDFVDRLSQALRTQGCLADFDRADADPRGVEFGVSPQDEWWPRIKELIAAADAFVFVVSPSSVASTVCGDELEYARQLGRRIVPIQRYAIDFEQAPAHLRSLNVRLEFGNDSPEAFARSLTSLRAQLETDVAWHRHGVRLARQAQHWDAEGRADDHLIRAGAITAAFEWAARRPSSAEPPGPMVLAFLEASQAKEDQDRQALARSEHKARLKAADALFEGGLAHAERGERFRACSSFFAAAAVAPFGIAQPDADTLPGNDGWARHAWTAASIAAVDLPIRMASYTIQRDPAGMTTSLTWFDEGRHLLIASDNQVTIIRFHDLDSGATDASCPLQHRFDDAIVCASGARRAARLALLASTGRVHLLDFGAGSHTQLWLEAATNDRLAGLAPPTPLATLALSEDGQAIAIARSLDHRDDSVVEVRDWRDHDGRPRFSTTVPGRGPGWVGFSPDGTQVGVHCNGSLHLIDHFGRAVVKRGGVGGSHVVVAPDLSACAASEFDLGQVWYFEPSDDDGSREQRDGSAQAVVLHGAKGMLRSLAFGCDGARLLGDGGDAGVLEWRRPQPLERGLSMGQMQMLRSFGVANQVSPWSHHEGLGRPQALATHPTRRDLIAIQKHSQLELWRLRDGRQPAESVTALPRCARVAVQPHDGMVALATEKGIFVRTRGVSGGTPGRQVGPATLTWDVAMIGGVVAAAYDDGAVRLLKASDGSMLQEIWPEAKPNSVAFSPDASALHIGLDNGVVWTWMPGSGLRRIAALGIGPIRKIRLSADGTVAISAGKAASEDPEKLHAGLALWSPTKRQLLWTCHHGAWSVEDADISSDGRLLLVGHHREARLLDASDGSPLSAIEPPQTDPSKPDHVTAVAFGPDDRTALLGLWDGSIVHADVLSRRVLARVKGSQKVITGLAADAVTGLVYAVTPATFATPLLVWHGWDPEFFQQSATAETVEETRKRFESRHGELKPFANEGALAVPMHIEQRIPADPLAAARAIQPVDEMRAADLFVAAARAGALSAMEAEEIRLAGQVLLDDEPPAGLAMLDRAAKAGSLEAIVRIGIHHLGAHPSEAEWRAALPYFEFAGGRGHAHAAYIAGHYYDQVVRGNVGLVDWRAIAAPRFDPHWGPGEAERTALQWYQRAAAAGSAMAAKRLEALALQTPIPFG